MLRQFVGSLRLTKLVLCCGLMFVPVLPSRMVAAPSSVDASAGIVAETPPMGWNSWDGFGTTINEAQFKSNADFFAKHLKPYGWQYVVVDMEWFVLNPTAEGNSKHFEYSLDEYGRYVPPVSRFPSAEGGHGFQQLAKYAHSRGLKFGIHILRGIPREAVRRNLPIAGSPYHASNAAILSDTCPWNFDNYGVDPEKPAGQAYYNSIAKLYAGWGIDFVKVDCISSHPYKADEIQSLSTAIRKTNRPMVLSLSPGPSPLEKADELAKYAQMWRISNDIWDIWHNDKDYPKGLGDQFDNLPKWAALSGPGHWPDADMLPLGRLGPAPGWGKPRTSQLSHDEQRTLVSLWSIFRSPLMIGGDLSAADEWTLSLLTNPEVIAVDQDSRASHPAISNDQVTVWVSKPSSGDGYYLAAFNRSAIAQKIQYRWSEVGVAAAEYGMRDLWERKDIGPASEIDISLRPHACVLYRLSPRNSAGK